MMNLFKRLFHKHDWVYDYQDFIGEGRFHCVSHCSICGKTRSEILDIHRNSL